MSIASEPHAALGAYLLHALPADEESAFANHLAGCDSCRRDLAALMPVLVRLCTTEGIAPPPGLRERVLAQIAGTAQEPGRPAHRADPVGGARSLLGGQAAPGPSAGPRADGRGGSSAPLRWALAACLAAAAVFGGIAVWQHQEAAEARTELRRAGPAAQLAEVLAAPDARISTADFGDGATGCVIVSRAESRAAFMASGLPKLTSDQVYELWYDDAGTPRSAGTLSGRGKWHIKLLDGPVEQATALGITVEPAGGSAQPTGSPIGLIDIPA
ncbi:anti-sigma factor domain-containing protein [Streptomyces sp. NPDC058701]|uniref:anti-sigma factor n=1 Tax=Streptomyces sp. NPDC058701 TaxID=3346608 RepID=UPI0036652CDB